MAKQRKTTPMRPDDARAQRSIDALSSAFLDLLEIKSLDEISNKEIADAAGLSYPTFFRRFSGKAELLDHIAAQEVRTLLWLGEAGSKSRRAEDMAEAMCHFVQRHRKLWKVLLSGGAASKVREEFIKVATEISASRPRSNPWLPEDLAVAFVTAGMFEILAWWMRQPEDYPIRDVINIFHSLIIETAGRPRKSFLDGK